MAGKTRKKKVIDVLYKKALDGDYRSIEFFLCNIDPENWKRPGKRQPDSDEVTQRAEIKIIDTPGTPTFRPDIERMQEQWRKEGDEEQKEQ